MTHINSEIVDLGGAVEGYIRKVTVFRNSENSPRIRGRLNFRQNNLQSEVIKHSAELYDYIPWGVTPPRTFVRSASIYVDPWTNGSFLRPSDGTSDVTDRARTKFFDKCEATAANLAEVYAERQKSFNMVAHRITQLAYTFEALRHRDLRKVKSILQTKKIRLKKGHIKRYERPSELWLELWYGWVPLVKDIYHVASQPPTVPALLTTGNAKKVFTNTFESSPRPWEFLESKLQLNSTGDVKSHVRAVITPDVSLMAHMSAYGFDNPVLLAWELLPYSFVVDWAFNVGDYLQQFGLLSGCKMEYTSITTGVRSVADYYVTGKKVFDYMNNLNTRGHIELTNVSRDANVELSRPAPHFKNPLSALHLVSALSLLSTTLNRNHFK